MTSQSSRDIFSGLALLLFGIVVAVVAVSDYRLGTLLRAGPGMFPAIVGVVMALLGGAIAISGVVRRGRSGTDDDAPPETVEVRALIVILASIGIFGLLVDNFGLLPAILAQIFVAAFAEKKVRLGHTLILAPILAATAILIFQVLLGVPFDILNWPF
ncbi:tripartite tricarboxylate transporter TctB family protein [Roseovarius sp. S1116L3]|uniref:tripartite tricarboxylate transporter TctB family protein n=1 Tax=Roseovarius roseus TaxID=3342636 RepID=UPI003727DF85